MSHPQDNRRPAWILALVLAAVTLFVYGQITRHEFIVYDDPDYITSNGFVQRGLTGESMAWAFSSTNYSNWHPLTWLSHMLDWTLFGNNPGAHHFSNLLLHIAATLLLFHALRRMTGSLWRSGFVAAMFAWHPMHVESVAWASERKDVLSAVFWMLTLIAYHRYVQRPGIWRYTLALLLFALGLMSKPMLVTLPCVLLLLDLWPLKRLPLPSAQKGRLTLTDWLGCLQASRRLLIEKIPFFALTLASCAITFVAQKEGQAVAALQFLPLSMRIVNATVGYLDYLLKAIWPVHLAVFYPLPQSQPAWKVATAIAVLTVVSVIGVRSLRSRPYLLVGWLWFLGTLVPVIGLVQVGSQAIADRYTYIPFIGLGIIVAWGVESWTVRSPSRQLAARGVALAALAAWVVLTGQQVTHWRDTRTLFEHAVAVTENNHVALNVLGHAMLDEHPPRIEEAKQLFRRSIELRPRMSGGYQCLGDAFFKEGNYDEAIVQYRKAIEFDPKACEARTALGMAYARKNEFDRALPPLSEAIRVNPYHIDAHVAAAYVLQNLGRIDEAVLGYQAALKLNPHHKPALFNLGNTLMLARRYAEAITYFRRLIQLDAQSVDSLNRLAWVLSTAADAAVRNGAEAVQLATRSCELTRYQNPQSLNSLAAAYAEAGRFEDAVDTAKQAFALAQASGQTGLAGILQKLLELYQARQPYREG